jgi:thymidylate synthase
MTPEFQDLNEVIKHYSHLLLESSPVQSTNIKNDERYKNKLGGEVIQEFFKILDPTAIVGTFKNHKPHEWWSYGEMLSELLNLSPPLMYKYRPELFDQHYDLLDDGTMQYTYSSRWAEFHQLLNVYKRLKENPNSKRAVIAISTPYDTSSDRCDSPCTTQYHFLHRDGKLNMSVFYRSHDFFGGFKTYDFALSSFVLQSFCSWLGMSPGILGVYENSLHYYNRDREVLEKLVDETDSQDLKSDKLIVDGNLGITDFYQQLRKVKASEEAAYNFNFERARHIRDGLTPKLFQRMCDVYLEKNRTRSFEPS